MTTKEVRELWVKTLLSGEYEQGTDYLQKDGKFCCLGVLCEIAVKKGVIPEPMLRRDVREFGEGFRDVESLFYGYGEHDNKELPKIVRDWVGLGTGNGAYVDGNCLAHNNDNGYSFKQIAEIIQKEPEGLFV